MMPKSTAPILPSRSTNMFPGCWSPWKKPSRKACLKKIAAARASTRSMSMPGGQHARAVVHADAGQPLQGQRRAASSAANRPAARDRWYRRRSSPPARRRRRASSRRSISTRHHGAEGLDHRQRLEAAQPRLAALDPFGDPEHEVEIAGEGLLDAGPQDLDRDRLALGGDGVVHLGDGGGRDRRVVEAEEQRLQRLAELGLERWPRPPRPEMAAGGPAAGPGRRHLLAQYVGAGGEELAELDEDGAEIDQGARPGARPAGPVSFSREKSRASSRMAGASPAPSICCRKGASAPWRARVRATVVSRAMLRQARNKRPQMRQAEWRAAMPPERLR